MFLRTEQPIREVCLVAALLLALAVVEEPIRDVWLSQKIVADAGLLLILLLEVGVGIQVLGRLRLWSVPRRLVSFPLRLAQRRYSVLAQG